MEGGDDYYGASIYSSFSGSNNTDYLDKLNFVVSGESENVGEVKTNPSTRTDPSNGTGKQHLAM